MGKIRLKGKYSQQFKEFVPLTDDFMFCSVMEDEERCKEFLQRVLGIKIVKIKCVIPQKSLRRYKRSKGIRLDVYVTDDEGNSYDIEMQTTKERYLAKRTRYYHSEMDGYQIKKGEPYEKLCSNIVIFICTYDPFGFNESLYKFETVCRKHPECNYDDGLLSVFLNVNGNMDDIADDLKNVLEYLRTGKINDTFTKDLDNQVKLLNNDTDWRDRQMTFEMKLKEQRRQGYEDGISQGIQQGIEQGLRKNLYDTINKMLSKGLSPREIISLIECSETDIEDAQKQ